MDLEQRVAELERRLDALESSEPAPRAGDGDFWALEGLKAQLADVEGGGVLFTGSVRLPTEERYEWQYGMLTDQLLDADWSERPRCSPRSGTPCGCGCCARSSAAGAPPPNSPGSTTWARAARSTTTCAS